MSTGIQLLTICSLLLIPTLSPGQDRYAAERQTLEGYVGQEILVVDTTLGERQFLHEDALLAYRVTLVAVMTDHLVVMRNVEGDRRSFLYPLGIIRRVVTKSDGKPINPIVIEMF